MEQSSLLDPDPAVAITLADIVAEYLVVFVYVVHRSQSSSRLMKLAKTYLSLWSVKDAPAARS